MIKREKVVQS